MQKAVQCSDRTIMHATKIPVRLAHVIYECARPRTVSLAREIDRKYGLCPRTAWHMLHRIREAMSHDDFVLFSGDVVADEVYIGGPDFRHADKRGPRYTSARLPLSRSSMRTLASSVPPLYRQSIPSRLATYFEPMWTWQRRFCTRILTVLHAVGTRMAGHYVVDHKAGIYPLTRRMARNLCENYFAQLKRG